MARNENQDLNNINTSQCLFNNPNLYDELFLTLRELREDRSNCDICLNVNGSKIYAHRNVLAGGTPFFFNMFYGVFTDRQKPEIIIEQIDFEALEEIVNYFYSGDIKITDKNVKKLFQASDRIQVDFIKKKCIAVFSQLTTTTNWFDFWDFAESINSDSIRQGVFNFIFRNFEDIIKTDDFLNLSFIQIYTMTTEQIFKQMPKGLYRAVLKWVKHNLNLRQQHFYDLIKCIEFKKIDKTFIKTYVATEDLIKEDHRCLLILTEILLCRVYPHDEIFKKTEWTDSVVQKLQPCIFVLSSIQDQHKSLYQIYNPYIECIKLVKPINIERNFAGITCQKGLIYVAGGRTKTGGLSNLCDVYNIATNEWFQTSSMAYGMDLNALVSHGGLIYSIGKGMGGSQIYNPTQGVWRLISHLPRIIFGDKCSADVIGNRIHVIDSNSIFGHHNIGINSITAYDPRMQNWETLAINPGFGSDASAAAIDNKLYISWTDEKLSYLSEFDVRSQKFNRLANMDIQRPCHDLIKYEDHLYAIGGKNISTVEEYDINNNCWSYVNSIKGSFSYIQAAVPDYVS